MTYAQGATSKLLRDVVYHLDCDLSRGTVHAPQRRPSLGPNAVLLRFAHGALQAGTFSTAPCAGKDRGGDTTPSVPLSLERVLLPRSYILRTSYGILSLAIVVVIGLNFPRAFALVLVSGREVVFSGSGQGGRLRLSLA